MGCGAEQHHLVDAIINSHNEYLALTKGRIGSQVLVL